jgi:GTPase
MASRRASGAPTVVLVGRPNVGKSTLFNRITNSRRAIVTSIAGTTRDVNSLPAEWQGTGFRLVDTGGMFGASEDPLHDLVLHQGRKALD